jgi:hypothetical protein
LNRFDHFGTAHFGITSAEGLLMAAKKKIARRKDTKVSKKTRKKKSAIAKPLRAKLVKARPTVVAFVAAVPAPVTGPPIVISYDLVAKRAFEIWQRKLHTNYPEQNWKEAEVELQAELLELGRKSKVKRVKDRMVPPPASL